MSSINDTVAGVLTHLQDNYGNLMPQKIIECKDIIKKKTYHPQEPIATVFSAVEELLDFSDITKTFYTQHQAVNISYVIIHRTGKFTLAISKWNCMLKIQKTWFIFK